MLKALIPSIVLAGAVISTSAQAADGDKLLGFEFGVGYHLVDDTRYEGASLNFGLVIPVGQKFDVVVYNEQGTFQGTENGDRDTATLDVNELRFRVSAWANDTMEVKLFLGLGYGELTLDEGDDEVSNIVGDAGINFTVFKTKSGPVKGEIALNAFYRHFKFAETDNGLDTDDTDEFGGFVIGANVGLYF
jgi:hypothetical protein